MLASAQAEFQNLVFYRDMEAALLHLVLYVASVALAEVTKYFRENPFQGVVLHFTALRSGGTAYG